ncbi:MAG: class I SAM-dependent methyltransferase [Pseudomonadota bacterium]
MSFAQSHSARLDSFLDRLSPGAAVLELGCGGGQDANRIASRGFALDATDGIPAMVSKANERFDLNARLMRFDELTAVSSYDAIWAHACLLHCPRSELPDVLARIYQALRPAGWHFANYKLGTGEGRDMLGRLHNFPSPEWLCDAYNDANFNIIEREVYAGEAADGTQRDWLALTVQRSQ